MSLTKKELAQILDCWPPGQKVPNYTKLRTKFFTDQVLFQIGITREFYNKTNLFDRLTTLKIIEVLQIEDEANQFACQRS